MERNLITRYNFTIDEYGIEIVDKFKRLPTINLYEYGQYVDISIIKQFSKDKIVLFLHTTKTQGDIFCFDAKNHYITLIAPDCQSKLNCSTIENQYILLKSKQNNEPIFMFITDRGEYYSGKDKYFFEKLTKKTIKTQTLQTFSNGNKLKQTNQFCLGYKISSLDLYDSDDKLIRQICFTPDEINISQDKKNNTIIKYEQNNSEGKVLITPYGAWFGISKHKETDEPENFKVLYSNYNFNLVQEQLNENGNDFYNLYLLKNEDYLQDYFDTLQEYYDSFDPEILAEMITTDGTIMPFVSNLPFPPKISAEDDKGSISLRYDTQENKYLTKISKEGTPFTISKPLQQEQ